MKPMLASKWETRNENMFPFWAQPKLDGIRVLIGDDGYAYTRSLKPVRNEWFQSMIRKHALSGLIGLDCEVTVGDPTAKDCYTRTSSAVMSFTNDDIFNLQLHVFDVWDLPHSVFEQRMDYIYSVADVLPHFCKIVPNVLIQDIQMLAEYEAQLLEQGHEGVILRKDNALYKKGRGTPKGGELIKLKRFDDAEGKIVAYHEKMHNANVATTNALGYTERSGHQENLVPMDTLGAVEIELGDQWESKTVRVGSGFDDATRQALWDDRDNLVGKIVKYKYFAVGTKDAPRFPIFLGLRDADDMEPTQGSLL